VATALAVLALATAVLSPIAGAHQAVALVPADPASPAEGVVRDTVTVSVGTATPADGQGSIAPVAQAPVVQTADERRLRARRLSRSPLANERVLQPDGSVLFSMHNLLHAPLTLEVEAGDTRGAKVVMLARPRVTIPAMGRLDVASIRGLNPIQAVEVTFVYSAVIGDPKAVPDARFVYAWPFPRGAQALLSQGPGGPTHRDDFSRYAIDLAVAEGTPVLAARAGVVVFLESRYFESGMDRERFQSRANHVRILHDDGSMGLYAHLAPASIDLEPGQRVEVGQQIGRSGNTGYSSGPHLHFVVLVHRDMQSVSVPFRMAGVSP
jgi:murein DD-endopeptidase MepM/ murein hydrolase activator NlpD